MQYDVCLRWTMNLCVNGIEAASPTEAIDKAEEKVHRFMYPLGGHNPGVAYGPAEICGGAIACREALVTPPVEAEDDPSIKVDSTLEDGINYDRVGDTWIEGTHVCPGH